MIPQAVGVPIGHTILLKCVSANKPVWQFNNGPLIGAKLVENNIYIPSATTKHMGHYTCNGTYPNYSMFRNSARVFVGSKLIFYRSSNA